MNILRSAYIIIFVLLFGFSGSAQVRLDDVDTSKIEYPAVIKYINRQMDSGIETFEEIQPSLNPGQSVKDYNIIDREFLIRDSVNKVWDAYVNSGLQRSWSTRKIHYGFAYSRHADSIFYVGDKVNAVIPGLIVNLNLNILFGIKSIAMAFEITRVDEKNKIIEFSYLKGNETEGKQQLIFEPTAKGNTLITHLSFYHSRVKPRDKLYPYVHAQIINRFHRNMKRLYQQKMDN
ncbi:MAG: hypothetical protein ACK5M7_20265 [Draconibacterium sp.]